MKTALWVLAGMLVVCQSQAEEPDVKQLSSENPAMEMPSGTAYRCGRMSLDLWGGYAYLLMEQMNQAADDLFHAYQDARYMNVGYIKFHNGLAGGLDLNYELAPGLKIGPRVGFIYAFPGDVSAHTPTGGYRQKWGWEGWVLPVSAGLSYSIPPASKARFSFGANAGAALGSGTTDIGHDDALGKHADFYTATATGFYGDVFAALKLAFTDFFGMDFRLGYRFARLENWKVTRSTDGSGYATGDIVKDFKGAPMTVDFSGPEGGIGLNFTF